MRVVARDVAVGFLYHQDSGKVLLHLRGVDQPPSAGMWAFFGGRAEPEDGGDPLATWRREMRAELGVEIDPARVALQRHGTTDAGSRWHDYYCEWPSLDQDFVLTEGQRHAWFTLDEAFSLLNLAGYARDDVIIFRNTPGQA